MKFKQFLDNYRIYTQRVRHNPHALYEKGDWKYVLFQGIIAFIPAVIFFVILVIAILKFAV